MRLDKVLVNKRVLLTKLLLLSFGVYIGFNVSNWIKRNFVESRVRQCSLVTSGSNAYRYGSKPPSLSQELQTKQLLFAGVMTAEKFLSSRASAVYNTWGKLLPGKVVFFAGNKTGQALDIPLVTLNGVDDSYPPQRKSLMMLKFMHDNYIDQFEYFMRCDDDVYIRTDRLKEFLRSFDSSQDLFIGQAGIGARDEQGRLGLGSHDNFCMGGPGVILSRSVLKKLAPHLEYCAKNLVSSHEDVEVGRCVNKHVGVSCTWAFEMQWLFYHNQSKSNAFHWDLETKAVQNAITLHPVKDPKYMYRIHIHFLQKKIQELQHRSVVKETLLRHLKELKEEKLSVERIGKLKEKKDLYLAVWSNSSLHWEIFDPKMLFTTKSPPTVPVDHSIRKGLDLILRKSLSLINAESRKVIFRELVLSRVNLGYMRISPTHGAQYVLDLRMITYQHLGYSRRKLPLNVHYQAHVQQSYGNLVYTSSVIAENKPYIHIILPLAGRLQAFATFLSNFEKVVLLNNENVKLLVMYFPEVAPYSNHKKVLKIYQEHYPTLKVIWKTVHGPFSRGLALQLGLSHFGQNDLLFFCDVDLIFDVEFLRRCRQNSIRGKRVYYPIVFSQFNQSLGNINKSTSYLNGEKGFWRKYGFGIVCAYGRDVEMVGGFNTNIKGWGLEDVELYERFVSSGRYDILRAPDPGLIHVHHASVCRPDLEQRKLLMCYASKLSQLSSARSLVDHMEGKGYFLNLD